MLGTGSGVSIPAVRVRYIVGRFPVRFDSGVSIPAVRVRYIIMRFVMCLILDSFNSRSAGKIHFHCSHLALVSICFNSRSAGKIHWAAIDRHARRAGVSIPAVRVRYIYIGPEMEDANGVSIPAVRVRYIETYVVMEATKVVSIPAVRVRYIFGHGVFVTVLGRFNSRSAGKIH